MAATSQNFQMWQGEDKEIVFTIEDADDLSGSTAQWRMAELVYRPAVITKSGIIDGSATTVTVILEPSDTESLTAGTWRHQLRLIDSGGKQNKAAEGTVTLHRIIPPAS